MNYTILMPGIYDATDAEDRRFNTGVQEIKEAGQLARVRLVKRLEAERLLGMERPRLPRFCEGEPNADGAWPRDRHGGLRWLRKQLAALPAEEPAVVPEDEPAAPAPTQRPPAKDPEPTRKVVCEPCEPHGRPSLQLLDNGAVWWRCFRCGHLIVPRDKPEPDEYYVDRWDGPPDEWTAPGYALDVGWGIWPGGTADLADIREMLRTETGGKFWPIDDDLRAVIDEGALFATTGNDGLVVTSNPPRPAPPEGAPPPVRNLVLREPNLDELGRTHIGAGWHVPADDGWPPGHSHIEWQWGIDGEWLSGSWGHHVTMNRATGIFPYYGGDMKAASTEVKTPGLYMIRVRLHNGIAAGDWRVAQRRAAPLG